MVKQLKKRADHEDKAGTVVVHATRVSNPIDKRKRHEAGQETLRGTAARRRSLGDAKMANKENDTPGNQDSLLNALGTPLSELLPLASDATRPLVDLYEAFASSKRDVPDAGPEERQGEQQSAPTTPCHVVSKRHVGIMRWPSTPKGAVDAPSADDDQESLYSERSRSARSKSSRTTASSYAESTDQLKSIRQEVMASMLTPEFGRHSQITDFYNKLNETDPNARDRARINHMAAVLLKNRHEREQYAIAEGYNISVRTGVGAEAGVKRKMINTVGRSTPSKTPRRTANFDTVHCIRKVQQLANQKLSDHDIARHPSLRGLNLTPAKVSIMRTGMPLVDHSGPKTPFGSKREVNVVGTPTGAVAFALGN